MRPPLGEHGTMVCMIELQRKSHYFKKRNIASCLQFIEVHMDKTEGYGKTNLWIDEMQIEMLGLNEVLYLAKDKH